MFINRLSYDAWTKRQRVKTIGIQSEPDYLNQRGFGNFDWGIILSKIFRTVPEFEIKEMPEANKPDFEVMVGR